MTIVTLSGVEDLQEANAIKNPVATIVSSIAVIILAFKGLILWNYGILMVIGAILGGLQSFAMRVIGHPSLPISRSPMFDWPSST